MRRHLRLNNKVRRLNTSSVSEPTAYKMWHIPKSISDSNAKLQVLTAVKVDSSRVL